MKSKSEHKKSEPNNKKITNLRKDIDDKMKVEITPHYHEKYKTIMEFCSDDTGIDKEKMFQTYKFACTYAAENEKNYLTKIYEDKSTSLEEKARHIAWFLGKKEWDGLNSENKDFYSHISDFLEIIKTDSDLNSFLSDSQNYINSHPNLSVYNLQILQFIANDHRFNRLPSINRVLPDKTFIYTPLTNQTYRSNFDTYGSMDATRFPQCINPAVKNEIKEKEKKGYYGPTIIGMGVQGRYDRGSIAETALHVRQMKAGACHTFAQLAADDLLTAMEQSKLKQIPIKIVSHKQQLGSHTFLLLDHTSDDLTDLSDCLIVDPWAVAMGYNSTYGVFTKANYPYPEMTTKLECCYDSQTPIVSAGKEETTQKPQSLNQQLNSAVQQRERFFPAASAPTSGISSNPNPTATPRSTQTAGIRSTQPASNPTAARRPTQPASNPTAARRATQPASNPTATNRSTQQASNPSATTRSTQSATTRTNTTTTTSRASRAEAQLDTDQIASVGFIVELMGHTHHEVKEKLMETLIQSVIAAEISPEKGMTLALLALYSKSIEKDGDEFKWKGKIAREDNAPIIAASNNVMAIELWKKYAKDSLGKTITTVDTELLHTIVNNLEKTEDHQFSRQSNTRGLSI